MVHPSRSLEDNGAEGDLNYGGLVQRVSEGKNSRKWLRDFSCDILAKTVAAFHSCPKNLPEAKLKVLD